MGRFFSGTSYKRALNSSFKCVMFILENDVLEVFSVKLSMWTLSGWLERRGFNPSPIISSGKSLLNGPRFMERGVSGSDTVGIIPADNVTGGAGYKTVLTHDVDLIFIPDADPVEVHNEITRCFESFNQWERDMLMVLVDGGSLQDLLEVAHRVFKQPMFIKGDSSWVFAITSGYDPSVHPDWANLERSAVNRTADFESVFTVSLDPEFQKVFLQHAPVLLPSPLYGGRVLRTNVWLDGQRVCEIVALEHNARLNPGDLHLMEIFSDMVSRFIAANRSLYFSFTELTSFFTGLLERQECNPANLLTVRQATGWNEDDALAVAVIREKTPCESPILGVLREKLSEQLPHSCVFHYGCQVVCIFNVTKSDGYAGPVARLEELIPTAPFTWGVSYDFVGLERLPEFYRQALTAMETAEDLGRTHATMYQAACACLSSELKDIPGLQGYIHPDLRHLEEVDRQGDSQYVHTLFEYLLCGGNYTDTAARLGLHRNSLIYRMSRIQEIISSDLSDHENRKLLLYSFFLLGKH